VKVFGEKGLTSERVYEFALVGGRMVRGMGIRKGEVVVLCGGGFHGKSTLLSAITEGCYNHVPGGEQVDPRRILVSDLIWPRSFFF
jgi:predicted ABC-class ATPase